MRMIWALVVCLAVPAAAQEAYLDDRSSPEAVVASLYNAINQGDFARAWSYFLPDRAPSYTAYLRGYDTTATVIAYVEPAIAQGEGWHVPVVLEAEQRDGTVVVFSGCYSVIQPEPRSRPPYQPIAIRFGHFHPVEGAAEHVAGHCDWDDSQSVSPSRPFWP